MQYIVYNIILLNSNLRIPPKVKISMSCFPSLISKIILKLKQTIFSS